MIPPPTVGQMHDIAEMMWPEFVEVRGCVLLKHRYEPNNFEGWWETTSGDTTRIEAMINHTHLYDKVNDCQTDDELAALEDVAQRLKQSLAAALAQAFPARSFTISYATEPDEYGPTVTFSQSDE